MLVVTDFSLAWPLVDPRRGRRTVAEIIELLELAVRVDVPDYFCEGTWLGDERRDARLDLEAILPASLIEHADDFGLALGWGDEAAAERLGEALLNSRWAEAVAGQTVPLDGLAAVSHLCGILRTMAPENQLA
jgi:hypothetical protein